MVSAYDKADAYSLFYKGAVRRAVALLDEYSTSHADIVLASSPQLEFLPSNKAQSKPAGWTMESIAEISKVILDETRCLRST